MIQALTHSDRDIGPDERIVQLSHVILSPWSAVRQMALQSSRARWCKPLNLAALPSHAESPSVPLHAIRAPSHRSLSHRCLHRCHSHYGYCSPHPCSCGQPARTRKTDKALKVINFATCTCAPPAPARHPHVLRARERAAHLVLAALAVAQHAAEHGSVLPDVAPSTSGCPFSRGLCSTWCPCESRATTTASTG